MEKFICESQCIVTELILVFSEMAEINAWGGGKNGVIFFFPVIFIGGQLSICVGYGMICHRIRKSMK